MIKFASINICKFEGILLGSVAVGIFFMGVKEDLILEHFNRSINLLILMLRMVFLSMVVVGFLDVGLFELEKLDGLEGQGLLQLLAVGLGLHGGDRVGFLFIVGVNADRMVLGGDGFVALVGFVDPELFA